MADEGTGLNEAVLELKGLGITGDDLTVVLKREDPDELEPFPDGTRYIVVPDDSRGLGIAFGFAIVFIIVALLFAFTVPILGTAIFVFFITLAALLYAATFTSVGAEPILIDMRVPSEDADLWNEAFEKGRVLVFAATERRLLRSARETMQRHGADFYLVERRLIPQPVSGATLRRAGDEQREKPENAAVAGESG